MRTRAFGTTGWELSVIGLGGMPLSLEGRPSEKDAIAVIHAALDAGMTLIDTADVYCIDDSDIGHNEVLIRKALATRDASSVKVATKGGLRRPRGAWTTDGSASHLREACEKSLRALGVDRIDVYQLHAPDDEVPFTESVGVLARLREEGKIAHVGLSNVSVEELRAAQKIVPIVSVQNRLHPLDLSSIRGGVVAACEREKIAFLPYSPVGGSHGKARIENDPALTTVAKRHGATTYEVALAFILSLSDAMFPIPGASRVASAISSARAATLTLDATDRAALDHHFHHAR